MVKTHSIPELIAVDQHHGCSGAPIFVGSLVKVRRGYGIGRNLKIKDALGVCIGRYWGRGDLPMQCVVLWSTDDDRGILDFMIEQARNQIMSEIDNDIFIDVSNQIGAVNS